MKPSATSFRPSSSRLTWGFLAFGALLTCNAMAQAQYKVVQPDGSTTYTDRPPVETNARITSLNRRGTRIAPDAIEAGSGLPVELRLAAQRYPVTLYTGNECQSCEAARRFLQQRGVPYAEKRVASEEDVLALERIVGARAVPALTIGSQPLRGLSETDWTAYLDAAGYPKESKLPRNWQSQPVQALVEKTAAAKPEKADGPPVIPELPQSTTGPRF
jgi:glutaredoxin